MTREEAIKILRNFKAMAIKDRYIMPNSGWSWNLGKIINLLQEKPTLAGLLGWEEGAEYKYKGPSVLKVENNRLYAKSRECSSGWCNFTLFTDEIEDLRQAKKVEKKETKEELLDELQEFVSSERIDEIIEKLRRLDNE